MAAGDPAVFRVSLQDVKQRKKPLGKGLATPEKAMITLDAMKALDPCQLKPDSMETERIITVLDETIAKLEMSSLIPRIIDSLDRFADVLGPEITNNLIEHQKLSNEMEHLLASSEEEDTMRAEEQQGCLCLLEQRLKCSVRNVLRLLLANPSLCQALKYEAWARESPAEVFIKAFGEFRNFMLERLLTSPVEEEEKIQFMEDISLQIKKNAEAVTALQAELAAAIRTREEEIHKKDNVIKDLKTSMQDLAKVCKAGIQQIKQEGEKQQKEELQASQARCARLQQDVQQLGAQLNALVLEHRASELALRKRKCRVETEIVNWIQKYDTDMGEKQAEYEDVNAAYTEEKAQLSLLMEKRAVLLQEYSQIEEERRICQEKKEQALKEFTTMTLAATRIQAFWRGYLVRSLFKSKRKKKKGKGKKTKK
ncbi:dynein regulatory complex protein 10 [Aquila chrysaetos chrysaetos]|uniref:Dynein regulatory complex protein 10 n=1 Tax=Aquila chrysaetos chrysaetos TaxID=223781 RepID=A0A663DV91_AQUCH|nr:dynein regulatory complex protein 10 [Aquila chrysaetos chrysaetos]XP_029881433.1 dynein regulatory complex protein 10 [Aquila chrysaetos chrysaetos]XP_029881434.1 dynein regulatory complex protein 10 [Aquila chrysaetos chrysaetos]